MSKQRKPKRDEMVDPVRTIYWFQLLARAIGSSRPTKVERTVIKTADNEGEKKGARFATYANGSRVPQRAMILLADTLCSEATYVIDHALWPAFRDHEDFESVAKVLVGKLDTDIQFAIKNPDNQTQIQERDTTHRMLLRRFGLDSLAALVILFRINCNGTRTRVDSNISILENAKSLKRSIFYMLMLIGADAPEKVRSILINLFVEKVFNIDLSGNSYNINFNEFDYSSKCVQLRTEMADQGITITAAVPLSRENLRILIDGHLAPLWARLTEQ